MKRLIYTLLVLTVIGLGITYGRYRFVASGGDTGDYGADSRGIAGEFDQETPRTEEAPRHGGEVEDQPARPDEQAPHAREDVTSTGTSRRAQSETEAHRSSGSRTGETAYESELREVDGLIVKAAFYNRLGDVNVQKRQKYADKVFEITSDALDILQPLTQKYPGRADIEERLMAITLLRYDAMKEKGAR